MREVLAVVTMAPVATNVDVVVFVKLLVVVVIIMLGVRVKGWSVSAHRLNQNRDIWSR